MPFRLSARRAVIEWPSGREATLSVTGWKVTPEDPRLEATLNNRYSLAAVRARRNRAAARGEATFPDAFATAARAAALSLGAELAICDPPDAVRELERSRI